MPSDESSPTPTWSDLPVFRKDDGADPGSTRLEALGLAWLGEAMGDGGAAVVPARTGPGWLVEPHLDHLTVTPAAAEALGRALAVTHAAGAPVFGCAPPGWTRSGWMGGAWLPLVPHPGPAGDGTEPGSAATSTAPAATRHGVTQLTEPSGTVPAVAVGGPAEAPVRRWGEFYAADRLLPYLPGTRDNGSIDPVGAQVIERLASRLADGAFDSPQPALVERRARERVPVAGPAPTSAVADGAAYATSPTAPTLPAGIGTRPAVARTHGDLWSGNIVWTSVPAVETWQPPGTQAPGARGVVGVLIDPAAQGGHAETDLAELAVFGQPHLERITAAYQEVSPLADGWRERIGLHQLHMLLIHAVLFGGSYGTQTIAVAHRYV